MMHYQPNQPRFIRKAKRKSKPKTKQIVRPKNTAKTKKKTKATIRTKAKQTANQFTSEHFNQQKQAVGQLTIHDFRVFQRTIPDGAQNAFDSLSSLLNKHGSTNFQKLLLTKLH